MGWPWWGGGDKDKDKDEDKGTKKVKLPVPVAEEEVDCVVRLRYFFLSLFGGDFESYSRLLQDCFNWEFGEWEQ